jgi:MarR-like DNA-binding transcriptional regulator SgrR of sgrS sRNA
MMEEALKSGQQHNALELAQLAPEDLRRCCILLGGQWQNDTPTLRIPTTARWSRFSRAFYRVGQSSIWQGKSSQA